MFASQERLAELAGIDGLFRKKKVAKAIAALGEKAVWWPEYNIIFLPQFSMWQAANPNIWIGAMKNASNLPPQVAQLVMGSIFQDYKTSVDKDKPYYSKTLDKLRKLADSLTVPEPLNKPFATVPETHAHVTRPREPARSTECTECTEGTDITHTHTESERDIILLFNRFCELFPNKSKTDLVITSESTIWSALKSALEINTPDYWLNIFSKASESDFLTGRKKGKQKDPFTMNISFLINPANTKKILSGGYNAFQERRTAQTGDDF